VLENSAGDIREQDIFIVSDLDELVSREFLVALKNCEVHPITFGHYPITFGHYPITLGQFMGSWYDAKYVH
jgi:hypothetical protein